MRRPERGWCRRSTRSTRRVPCPTIDPGRVRPSSRRVLARLRDGLKLSDEIVEGLVRDPPPFTDLDRRQLVLTDEMEDAGSSQREHGRCLLHRVQELGRHGVLGFAGPGS